MSRSERRRIRQEWRTHYRARVPRRERIGGTILAIVIVLVVVGGILGLIL